MNSLIIFILTAIVYSKCYAKVVIEADLNIKVEAGSKTCVFEKGENGQVLEVYYQVLSGHHGDLDISFDVVDPTGTKLVSDYKKPKNSIIIDLEVDGDYAFCLDNTYSLMNSKLVFFYVLVESKDKDKSEKNEADVTVEGEDGGEVKEEEVLEWATKDENGVEYFIEVEHITASLTRTLNHVLQARRLLDKYSATKTRDSYSAVEETFVVDAWSGLQISFMFLVGMLQVYTIKKLFNRTCSGYKSLF